MLSQRSQPLHFFPPLTLSYNYCYGPDKMTTPLCDWKPVSGIHLLATGISKVILHPGKGWSCMKRHFIHYHVNVEPSQLGFNLKYTNLKNATQKRFPAFHFILCAPHWEHTRANVGFYRKSTYTSFQPWKHNITSVMDQHRWPKLCMHYILAGGSNNLQHTQKFFPTLENADFLWKVTLFTIM